MPRGLKQESVASPRAALEGSRWIVLWLFLFLSLSHFSQVAEAQGANAFGPSSAFSTESAKKDKTDVAEEGLKSATPSDDLVELDQANDTLNGNGQFSDLPEATNQATSTPTKNGGNAFGGGNDDLFGDGNLGATNGAPSAANGVASGAAAQPALDAFGKEDGADLTGEMPANPKVTNVPNKAAVPETINAMVSPNPVSNAPSGSPTNGLKLTTPPTNAQVLLNEIKKDETAPANLNIGGAPTGPDGQGVSTSTLEQGGAPQMSSSAGGTASPDVPPSAKSLPPPNEFAGAPPVPGTMRIMAEGEAPQEYRVQPGDTLFDICDQLIDEPGYWPKLWSLNPEIKNPHFIFPGMKLGFYPGDDETPPYLQVIQEDDIIPIDKGSLNEIALVKENVNLSEELTAPVEESIEVIGPDQVEVGSEIDEAVLSGGRIYNGEEVRLQVPGFIFAEDKSESGSVLGGRDGGITAGPGQDIAIEASGQLSSGQIYTVLRRHDKVMSPVTGDTVGVLYYFVANVRISRSVGSDVFIGRVQDNLLGVQADDILVDYLSTYRTIPATHGGAASSALDATVVAFEMPDGEIGGTSHFVFLDKGRNGGVSPGMYVRVYQKPGYLMATSGDSDLPEDWQGVATLRIIDVTDAGAVGYVVDSAQEVRIGDMTKKP